MEEKKEISDKIQEILKKIYASILSSEENINDTKSTWIRDKTDPDLSTEY